MNIELGRTYTDKVSGFKGVAVATTSYLTGCNRITLMAKCKPGAEPQAAVFDEPFLDLDAKAKKVEGVKSPLGGPKGHKETMLR